ncbi:hypothetical protein BT96DRAFT_1010023 [Gymnopus androsaceus JB14]|uniref:Uncharacterized protein n=1 Tax=Gymnopus androsaceus JB14 TaxID=1447944 RepID=A0A6A4GBM9_9AGAR|nr:hypothetical protein BT96DRAFT_1010023 [Gymnopus androsaceus JB14]
MARKRDRYAALLETPDFERTVRHQAEASPALNDTFFSSPSSSQGSSLASQHSLSQNPSVLSSSSPPLGQGSPLAAESSSHHSSPNNLLHWSSLFREASQPTGRYADIISRNLSVASPRHPPSSVSTSAANRFSSTSSPEADSLNVYGLTVMATTVLDAEHDISIRPEAVSNEFLESIILDVHEQAMESPVPSEHPTCFFGNPRSTNVATVAAIFTARSLQEQLERLRLALNELRPLMSYTFVQSALSDIETSVESISRELDSITRVEANADVAKARSLVFALRQTLSQLRIYLPDFGPLKVDNGASSTFVSENRPHRELEHAFVNPAQGPSPPVLIAYTLALVQRVFIGASTRAAGFTLRMIDLYGRSLTALAGGPTQTQKEAMNAVPKNIETVERRFNLDIPAIPYAVCPSCSYTHKPSYPNGSNAEPVYPLICGYRTASFQAPCTAPLSRFGRPIKTFFNYSFFEWFARLLALPDIEQYGDRFCDEITDNPDTPLDKYRPSDGRFYRELRDADGKLFIAD